MRVTVQFGKIILLALTAMGLSFAECKSGGLHEKHAIATWKLKTIPAFA
jgi:hypothetical protein